jgi:beta-lactamase superfamily II metal-dependent hydrolase
MQIEIFDVGHGHCSVMTAPNGTRMMLDCGTRWDEDSFWTPSLHYFGQTIPVMALLNLDEDHIGDFEGMLQDCGASTIITNMSIDATAFAKLKNAGMGPGAKAYQKWRSLPMTYGISLSINFGQVQHRVYRNMYGSDCVTTNDLSLAIVLQFGEFRIMFTGDLEAKGWCGLLANPLFCTELPHVNVLVASHHGRESGCHDALFKSLNPQLVIISDGEKQHGTQETDAWYRQRTQGANVIGQQSKRYVLTTRSDGSVRINVEPSGEWRIACGVPVKQFSRTKPKASALPVNGFGGFGLLGQPASTILTGNALADLRLGGLGLINRR